MDNVRRGKTLSFKTVSSEASLERCGEKDSLGSCSGPEPGDVAPEARRESAVSQNAPGLVPSAARRKSKNYAIAKTYSTIRKEYLAHPARQQECVQITERDLQENFESTAQGPGTLRRTRDAAERAAREFFRAPKPRKWWWTRFQSYLPILRRAPTYKRSQIVPDLCAGLSAGIAAIPIGMSYALIAELPPEYGLYSQLVYSLVYLFVGSGDTVCIGASAVEALISAKAVGSALGARRPLEPFNEGWVPGTPSVTEWVNASIALALMVGVNLLIMRALGLAVIANFLADSVVSGFSSGSAFTIATTQLPHILGLTASRAGTPRRAGTLGTWEFTFRNIRLINPVAVGIAAASIVLLALVDFMNRVYCKAFAVPASLVLVAVATGTSYLLKLNGPGPDVNVIGVIPAGFPPPRIFHLDNKSVLASLYKSSLLYAVVYFLIHSSIARAAARRVGKSVDNEQELFAVGSAAFLGSFFNCYPIATSVARTSIVSMTGAQTIFWNVPNVLSISLTITILTPFLYHMPMAALGALVLYGVVFMFTFADAWRLLRLKSRDFLFWSVCFLTMVFVGPMEGLLAGVLLSILWIVKDNAFPVTGIMGRLPGTRIFRNITQYHEAEEVPGIKILHFDAPLNFSNAQHFEKKLLQLVGIDKHVVPNSVVTAGPESAAMARTLESRSDSTKPRPGAVAATEVDCTKKLMESERMVSAAATVQVVMEGTTDATQSLASSSVTAQQESRSSAADPEVASTEGNPVSGKQARSAVQKSPNDSTDIEMGRFQRNCRSPPTDDCLNAGSPQTSSAEVKGTEAILTQKPKRFRKFLRSANSRIFSDDDPVEISQSRIVPVEPIHVVIIDASCIVQLDITAIRMLEELAEILEVNGKVLLFANWRSPAKRFLAASGFYGFVPRDRCFLSLHDAMLCAEQYFLQRPSQETGSPS